MKNLVSRIFAAALALCLTACSPQWSSPVFESQAASPKWIVGLWVDRSGDRVVRLKTHDSGLDVLFADENFTFMGSAVVTAHDGSYFFNVNLKDGKYLSSGSTHYPGKAPLSGYLVSYVDRVSDDEIKVTQIDYDSLFSGIGTSKRRVGTDLCRNVALFGETLHEPTHLPQGPDVICDLLDTNVFVGSDAGVALKRSNNSIELFRTKVAGPSIGKPA